MTRNGWIEAARRVVSGDRDGIVCPARGDGVLVVTWLPFSDSLGGEFCMECEVCAERNFVLVRGEDPVPQSTLPRAPAPE